MAKVISLFKISGTISDLTFRQTKDGMVAQMKPGPTRERVLTHDRFRITRLVAAEFTMAGKAAKLLRDALGSAKDGMHVASLNGRMNGLLYKVVMSDTEHRLGERCPSNGNMQLLTGFDLNKDLLLANALPPGIHHHLDAATGKMKVELPAFIARKKKGFRKEATHFRIVSCGAVIDFNKRSHRKQVMTSELLPLRKKTPGAICMEHELAAHEGEVLVQVLGIQLYKLEDGKEVLLQGGAMRILEASRIQITRIKDELHELKGQEVGKGSKATRHQGNEGLESNEALRQPGNEGGEGIEASRQPGIGEKGAIEVGGGGGMECLVEEPGAVLEEVSLDVGVCAPEGVEGDSKTVGRRRKRARAGAGGRRQRGMEVRTFAGSIGAGGMVAGIAGNEGGTGVRGRGGRRLLFCRSSVDLHYICNPSDGTSWQPEGYEATGAPGNDP